MQQTATLVTFILYLLMMLAIGLYAYRQTSNLSDYILGGRRLGGWVTALSAGASDMSGWLLLGLPGAIYLGGLGEVWIAAGLILGAYFNWKITAPRIRIFTHQLGDALTLPDYLTNRFRDTTRLIRIISALIILVFFTVYVASGLTAGARLFETSFNIDYHLALMIGGAVIVGYTFFGGFLAVSWTDVVQGVLMALALVVTPLVIVFNLGGVAPAIKSIESTDVSIAQNCARDNKSSRVINSLAGYQNADDKKQRLIEKQYAEICSRYSDNNPVRTDWFNGKSAIDFIFSIAFLSLMAWGLGYFGQPHLLARFMAAKNLKEVHKARRIAMSWMLICLLGAVGVGFFGIAYFGETSTGMALLFNPETIFIKMSQLIFNPWIAGFLLAAILAAVMSTIDSQLLVSSSVITEDIFNAFFAKNVTQNFLVWVGRISVLIIALIAGYIASDPSSSVLGLVKNAWAGFGAAFGPVILLSLVWRKMTVWGALAGMISGAVTVALWITFKAELGESWSQLYEMVPGVIVATVSIFSVSLFGPGNVELIGEDFDQMKVSLN